MYKKGDKVIVTIEGLAFEGPAIARIKKETDQGAKELVVFVDGAAPGDEVEVQIYKIKKNFLKGRVARFIKMSGRRTLPRCPHFGYQNNDQQEPILCKFPDCTSNCGGCSWQFLEYEDQLKVKEQIVRDAMKKFAGLSDSRLDEIYQPIIGADSPWYYRNKMEFSFVRDYDGFWRLGLHQKSSYRFLTEIKECHLFRSWLGPFLDDCRAFFLNLEAEYGELKSLTIRSGSNSGQVMVNLLVENPEKQLHGDFLEMVNNSFKNNSLFEQSGEQLVSVYVTEVHNKKGQPKRYLENLLWGTDFYSESMEINDSEFKFEISPSAFFQPNTKQAEKLYALVGSVADLTGQEKLLDLFCGTGTIGLSLAPKAKSVIGLELNESAIVSARKNAEINGIRNIEFMVGDVGKILPEIEKEADLMIVDPPRAGLNPDVVETISSSKIKKLIYVSCNPNTLARDLKLFQERGFTPVHIQAVDQFCHTYHVETVVKLLRKGG